MRNFFILVEASSGCQNFRPHDVYNQNAVGKIGDFQLLCANLSRKRSHELVKHSEKLIPSSNKY